MRSLLALVLVALALPACDTADPGLVGGRYDVELYEGADLVARGSLDLEPIPVYTRVPGVAGRWRLDATREDRYFGRSGVLRGHLDGAEVRLSLLIGPEGQPALDAGVGLDGTADGDEIRGTWGEGFTDRPSGTFVARR